MSAATGGTMPAYIPDPDAQLVKPGAGSVHFGSIGAAWPGDFTSVGWCDEDGLTVAPELTTERLADFATALGGSSLTIDVPNTRANRRTLRWLAAYVRNPKLRRMHREYARRLKARRRRRR